MRARRLIVFIAIAVVMGGYYVLVEMPRQTERERRRARASALTVVDPAGADVVTVIRPDTRLQFDIVNTHWEMTAPLSDLADQTAVGRLLAAIAEATIERRLPPANDLAAYGLAPPAARVVWRSAAGDTLLDLLVGDNTVDNAFSYAMISDDEILLVPTVVRRYSLTAVEDFRNKRPVVFDVARVDAFTVSSHENRMRWSRRAPEVWECVVGGDTVRGDATAVEGVLRRLRGLRARGFAPPGTVDFSGAGTIELDMSDGATIRLRVAAANGGVFSSVDGEKRIVEVDSTALELFAPVVGDLRDHRVLRVSRDRVQRVSLTTPDTSATFVRAGDGWGPPNPVMGTFSARRVDRFWKRLDSLGYARILHNESRPSAQSLGGGVTFSLAVYGRGDTILDVLWYRPSEAGGYLATSRSSRVVGTITDEDMDALTRRVRELRSR